MSHRHLEEESQPVRALQAAAERDEQRAPAVERSIESLQTTAGNAAVASLLGRPATRHRGGSRVTHGAHAIADARVVQRAPGDDEEKPADNPLDPRAATDPEALSGGNGTAGTTDATGTPGTDAAGSSDSTGAGGATQLGAGAPAPGASWTKVGPPTNTTYAVSGSLRTVANAIAARTEAGSVTTTPSSDTDTFAPDGATEKVTAARVTVDQAMELPDWTDKSKATANQQAEWDRFFAAITTHEHGHVALDKTAYAGVHAKMVGLSQKDADAKLDAAEGQAKTDNTTYDTNNGHGVKQGTGINPNIDEVTKVP